MTKIQVLTDYTIDNNGVIRTPGKFEGEMYYVPLFWERGLEGGSDVDEAGVYGFEITAEDIAQFPELADVKVLALEESDSGFVNSSEWESITALEAQLEESAGDDSDE